MITTQGKTHSEIEQTLNMSWRKWINTELNEAQCNENALKSILPQRYTRKKKIGNKMARHQTRITTTPKSITEQDIDL